MKKAKRSHTVHTRSVVDSHLELREENGQAIV